MRMRTPALSTTLSHCAREGAAGQAVVCPLLRGRSPPRGVAPKQHEDPALSTTLSHCAREGAAGQAVVCPLLRGRSPPRGVAPKQHWVSGVLSLRHFGLVLLIRWRVGAEGIWRGEI